MNYLTRSLLLLLGVAALALPAEHFIQERQTIPDDISLSPQDPMGLEIRSGETMLDFASRLNDAVNQSTYHCLPEDFSLSWLERLTDRYWGNRLNLQWSHGLVGDGMICGFCHQRAITLANIMRAKGFDDAWAFGVIGHVVLKFSIDGHVYIADPDYGVNPFELPADSVAISATVRKAYARFPNAGEIAGMFASVEDNQSYYSPEAFQKIEHDRSEFFRIANTIAIILMAFGAVLIYWATKRRELNNLVCRIAAAIRN